MANIVRCRVDLKMFGKNATEWDREKAFRIMFQEFKHRCSDAGIMHQIKENQFYESKTRKKRKKLKETINRRKQDEIEEKLRKGEKVNCSGKIIKKIKARERLNKNKKKGNNYYREQRDRNQY